MRSKTTLMTLPTLALLASCGAQESQPDSSTPAPCAGKCDAEQELPAALASLPLDRLVSCTITRDNSTQDDFFAADPVTCQVLPLEGVGLEAHSVSFEVWGAGEKFLKSTRVERDDFSATAVIPVAQARTDHYPLTLKAHITWNTGGLNQSGTIDDVNGSFSFSTQRLESPALERPDNTTTHLFAPGFELWPVVVWPTAELESAWSQKSGGLLNIRSNGAIEFGDMNTSLSHDYNFFALPDRTASLIALTELTMWLPVSTTSTTAALTSSLEPNGASALDITAPTYVLLEKDGGLTPATPAQIVERGAARQTTPAPSDEPTDPGAPVDPIDEPDMPSPAPEPPQCDGQCGEQEVCVAGVCVVRSTQTQNTRCLEPTRACDAGEDSDCADGHVCVEGLCRSLECQTQSTFDCSSAPQPCEGNDDSDCANGHVCVTGSCRSLECQTQSTFDCNRAPQPCDAGEDSDCADGHVCVEGLCRNLECQTQSTFDCSRAPQPCDVGEDSDCAANHVCVEGLCRNLECQTQSTFDCSRAPQPCEGNDDGDCAANHVCVEGLCRNLECQTQSNTCHAPSRPCDTGDATDCAPGHSCSTEQLCVRDTCAE